MFEDLDEFDFDELDEDALDFGRKPRRRCYRPRGPLRPGARLRSGGAMRRNANPGWWYIPAPRSQGGPSTLWEVARRELQYREIPATSQNITALMRAISAERCNARLRNPAKGNLATLAFRPIWDNRTRRRKNRGRSYGMVFVPLKFGQ